MVGFLRLAFFNVSSSENTSWGIPSFINLLFAITNTLLKFLITKSMSWVMVIIVLPSELSFSIISSNHFFQANPGQQLVHLKLVYHNYWPLQLL